MRSPTNPVRKRTEEEQLDAWKAARHLLHFIEGGWRYVDPNPYQSNWHIEATVDHRTGSTSPPNRRRSTAAVWPI